MSAVLSILNRPGEGEPDNWLAVVDAINNAKALAAAINAMSADLPRGEERNAFSLVAVLLAELLEDVGGRVTAMHRAEPEGHP